MRISIVATALCALSLGISTAAVASPPDVGSVGNYEGLFVCASAQDVDRVGDDSLPGGRGIFMAFMELTAAYEPHDDDSPAPIRGCVKLDLTDLTIKAVRTLHEGKEMQNKVGRKFIGYGLTFSLEVSDDEGKPVAQECEAFFADYLPELPKPVDPKRI